MANPKYLWFTIPALFCFSLLLSISTTVSAEMERYGLLEDKSGTMSVTQIYKQRALFEPGPSLSSFGLTQSHIWFYLTAEDFSPDEKYWFEIDNAGIDFINLYRVSGSDLVLVRQTGDSEPFMSRMLNFRSFVFELDFPPGTEYLIEIYGESPLLIPVEFGTQKAMFERLSQRENMVMLVYGLILAVALFNLLLFVGSRHIPFGWYGVYMLCMITTLGFTSGAGNAYLWRDQFWFQNQFAYVVMILSIWSAFNFTRTFLSTKETLPGFDRYFRWLVHTPLVTLLLVPLGLTQMLELNSLFLGLLVLTVITLGSISAVKGVEGALLFLAGWSVLVVGLFLFNFTVLAVIPATQLGRYSAFISVGLEAMILSFAVMYRIRTIERLAKEKVIKANKEIQIALRQVEHSNAAKDAFVTAASHQLKTPIHVVMGNLQLLTEELHNTEHGKLVEQTDRFATELLYTIDNLLTYSQVVAEDMRTLRQQLNIRSEFMRIEHKWKHLYENRNIHFELSIDPRIPSRMEMEWIHVRKIIRIALEHAVHSLEKGHVFIRLKLISIQDNDWLKCLITDSSGGIPEPVCQWFNGSVADERWDRSSLGLFLCKHMIKHVGGEAQLSNLTDGGVQFEISWPVQCLAEEKLYEEAEINGQVILVVDDMPMNLKLMKSMLLKLNAKPLLAASGTEAIEMVAINEVDLVLMDSHMPGLSGQETARILRQETKLGPWVPIVAVSANDSDIDRESCLYSGMNDFIAKPVRMQTLEQKLKYWLVKEEDRIIDPAVTN